ncbi:ergot alkaloid biosynthesis protein, partial [Streptomyces sp. SID8361]
MAEPTVMVLGATGNTGSKVLRMVRAEGARALAATRRPEAGAA